jgi:hypothetical protein
MAYTQTQLDAIQEALARGVLEATLPDGSKVRYRSLDEMERIINKMESNISAPRNNVVYPSHSRGYE